MNKDDVQAGDGVEMHWEALKLMVYIYFTNESALTNNT